MPKSRIQLSLIFAHVPHAQLPTLARIACRFSAAAQLVLNRMLELSAAMAKTKADMCIASLAAVPHLAVLVTTLMLLTYSPAHGPSFYLALGLTLRSMRALAALALPVFDADLLAAAPPTLARLTLQAETLHFAFFDSFLALCSQIVHLALPNFVGVPPGLGRDVRNGCASSGQTGCEPGSRDDSCARPLRATCDASRRQYAI